MSTQHPTLYVDPKDMAAAAAGDGDWYVTALSSPGPDAPLAYVPASEAEALREQLAAVARERDDYKAALTSIAHPEGDVIPAPRAVAQAALSRPATQTDGQRRDLFTTLTKERDEALSTQVAATRELDRVAKSRDEWKAKAEAADKQWRCFQCNDVFTDEAEAKDHFSTGGYERPGCCDPLAKDEKARLKELRDAREHARQAFRERDEADNDRALLASERAEIGRRFGKVGGVTASTVQQAWLVYEAQIGATEAARARVADLEAAAKADQTRIAALVAAIRPMLADWERDDHLAFYGNGTAAQGLRDALSGGTAALAAHDAALREEIAREVEAHAEDVDSMHWRQAHRIIAKRIVADADVFLAAAGNRELLRENEVLRSNSDHLSSENASLARQVESMAMRIESLAEELAKPEDVRLREVLDALDGRAVIFDGLGVRVTHLLDEMDEWIARAGAAERRLKKAEEVVMLARQLTAYSWEDRLEDCEVSDAAKHDSRELSTAIWFYDQEEKS